MKRILILSLLAATAMLAGCGNDNNADTTAPTAASTAVMASATTTTPTVGNTIKVHGFTFAPRTIEVPVGTTITWANSDQVLHTVTSGTPDNPDGQIDGQMPEAGTSTSVTFDTAGTVPYFCSRHPFMLGEVVVR